MNLRVASRGSRLSLVQVDEVMRYLSRVMGGIRYDIVVVKTRGDVVLDKPLYSIGGKGLFEKDVDKAVLDGRADIAVHSMKDLPTSIHEDLDIVLVPPRGDPRDSIIPGIPKGTIESISPGSIIGTSSLRRRALLRHYNDSLVIRDIRGNIDTRLKKLSGGGYDYIVLAEAGLKRLSLDVDRTIMPVDMFPPAPGQGLLAVVALRESPLARTLKRYTDKIAYSSAIAERVFLAHSNAGCHTPIGGVAIPKGTGLLKFIGAVLPVDGSRIYWLRGEGDLSKPELLGRKMGEEAYTAMDRWLYG